MTRRSRQIRPAVAVLALLFLPLAGCGEVSSALNEADKAAEQVGGTLDKAKACTEALGISTGFNPQALDPQKVEQEAKEKATRLEELGNQVADADVKQTLLTMAEGYTELEQNKANAMSDLSGWLSKHAENLEALRKVCT